MKISVLHVMNHITPGSLGYELGCKLNTDFFDVKYAALLGVKKIYDDRIIDLQAKHKFDFRAIWRLHQLIKNNGFTIIHTHHNVSGSIARILAKLQGVPVVVDTEHGSHQSYKFLGNLCNDLTLFVADAIVNVSEWVKNSYFFWEKIFIPAKKTMIIYNGVDLHRVEKICTGSLHQCTHYKQDEILFLHIGRLYPVKNQAKLIEGFARLVQKHEECRLVIIGDGPLREKLHQLVCSLHVQEKIYFTGMLPREDVYHWLNRADCFVMNSLSEGLSAALLQAMAFAKPCILSDIPSFRETVKGEDIGEFIRKDCANEIENAFSRLLSTDKLALQKKGLRAKALVEKYYDFRDTVNKYERLYFELIDRKKEPHRDNMVNLR